MTERDHYTMPDLAALRTLRETAQRTHAKQWLATIKAQLRNTKNRENQTPEEGPK